MALPNETNTLSACSVNSGSVSRFTLPEFTPHDSEMWFAAAEHIFRAHSVVAEDAKFAGILQ